MTELIYALLKSMPFRASRPLNGRIPAAWRRGQSDERVGARYALWFRRSDLSAMFTPALPVEAPYFNEELNIPELARRVLHVFDGAELPGELVLADDGFSGGTRAATEAREKAHPGRAVGRFHPNRGMTFAWKTGVAAAAAPAVTVIDSDHDGDHYYWQSCIMLAAHAKVYSCKEVETSFENRVAVS